MKLTIFIDESGDFVTTRGEWVLGGFLCFEDFHNVNSKLFEIYNSFPSVNNLSSIMDFHFTELKKILGFEKTFQIAKDFIESSSRLPFKNYFISTIDYTKTKLKEKERTYRLMLLDIISIAESLLNEDIIIDTFDIIIATRTIDGVLQTNISQIEEDVIKLLEESIEYGLASRGLLKLVSKNKIRIQLLYANSTWGLVFADCISNLIYNQKFDQQKYFIHSLIDKNQLLTFESFGGLNKRKALIAERDKDYVQSLFYWLTFKKGTEVTKEYLSSTFIRNLIIVFNEFGATGLNHTIEALIEKIWRNFNEPIQYNLLISIITQFDNYLIEFSNVYNVNTESLNFRIRNFLILILNHTGNIKKTIEYLKKQSQVQVKISTNPDYFQQIIDFRINEIEFHFNSLNIQECFDLAKNFNEFVLNYKLSLEILFDTGNFPKNYFESSRLYIKSEMTLLRITLFSILSYDNDLIQQILNRIFLLKSNITNQKDFSRLTNLEIMALNKCMKLDMGLDLAYTNYLKSDNIFNLLWLLKSVNNVILSKKELESKIIKLISSLDLKLNLNIHQGHPYDLVYRELSLFQYIYYQDKSKAIELLKKSQKSLQLLDKESPIYKWLQYVSEVLNSYITNKPNPQFPEELVLLNEWLHKCYKIITSSSTKDELLKNTRYISPY
jgi:hypothetical protein